MIISVSFSKWVAINITNLAKFSSRGILHPLDQNIVSCGNNFDNRDLSISCNKFIGSKKRK
jgi:hypothetical protein